MAIKQQKRDAANSYTRSEAHVIPFVTDSGFTRTGAGSRKRGAGARLLRDGRGLGRRCGLLLGAGGGGDALGVGAVAVLVGGVDGVGVGGGGRDVELLVPDVRVVEAADVGVAEVDAGFGVPAGDDPVGDALVRGVRVPRDDDLVTAVIVTRLRAHAGRRRRSVARGCRRLVRRRFADDGYARRIGVRAHAVLVLRADGVDVGLAFRQPMEVDVLDRRVVRIREMYPVAALDMVLGRPADVEVGDRVVVEAAPRDPDVALDRLQRHAFDLVRRLSGSVQRGYRDLVGSRSFLAVGADGGDGVSVHSLVLHEVAVVEVVLGAAGVRDVQLQLVVHRIALRALVAVAVVAPPDLVAGDRVVVGIVPLQQHPDAVVRGGQAGRRGRRVVAQLLLRRLRRDDLVADEGGRKEQQRDRGDEEGGG